MRVFVDLSKAVPAAQIEGEDPHETHELKVLLREASTYLQSFAWCRRIREEYMGIGVGGVIGVFLFRIIPSGDDVDEWVWVVAGDLPLAYITAEEAPNAACALDAYIGAMDRWVAAAKVGDPTDGLIPVDVPPSPEHARQLEARLRFLDREILSRYGEDLAQSPQRSSK